ncbi:hypothetical protein FGG90_04160 [Clavibacter tessellarius]|uniref:FMN-dependent dehydrogenase n=1 Tax=Clavibacter tessellarius TaxID=31965 RepID=A0A225CQT6_9MICO|nr:hypothetical protein [Clavibacter michiganensis]OQJ63764.1 hypothetical protein B5P24_12555 [Clavibacter michiganensis subsp. tessellarius]UKF33258.1 hypothetical protein FGG90_04160 [Clavibacter michiganensis subsp. tessellarius]
MPSYRITMTVGALRAGADPSAVLPAAARVAAERATLEANDIQVVRGEPRLTVRFTADDDDMAERVAGTVRARTAELVDVPRASITRRDGGTWTRI